MNFVSLLKSFGVKAISGLAGWQAWILNFVLNKVWKQLVDLFNKYLVSKKIEKEVKKSLEDYDKAINDPNAAASDIKQEGKKFLED